VINNEDVEYGVISVLTVNFHPSGVAISVLSVNYHPFN